MHVKAFGCNPSYKGTFQWAEVSPGRLPYTFVICEKQLYKPEGSKTTVEGTAAVRHVPSVYVRHDAGVRTRRAREEANVE